MNQDQILHEQIEPLLDYFQNLIPLNLEEKALVFDFFKPRLYRKRQYILQEGNTCDHLNYIIEGCLRMYKIDEEGNTHIIQFSSENGWLCDIGSFHERVPSSLTIDALEDTRVLQISYSNLVSLYVKAPKFDRIFRVLMENSFVSLQKRLLQYISSSAEDRYLAFMASHSHLANRIPQTQIASFLGITPEFLSRLKNKQTKKR